MIRQVNLDMDEYRGLSSDTKPSGVANGATFLEIDTGAKYMYDEENGEWCLMSANKYVTPQMYGAYGDGIHDDTAALRNTIKSGRTVNLGGKTYLITGVLNFDNLENVELYNGTITRPQKQTFNTISGRYASNIAIHDIIFEGNGNTTDVTYVWKDNVQACCILASNGKNIWFYNNTVRNHNYGVFTLGANETSGNEDVGTNTRISHNTFINCNSAVDTYGKDVEVSYNTFLDITEHAIQIEPNQSVTDPNNPQSGTYDNQSGAGCVINGNFFRNIMGIAINIHLNTYGISIINNTILDFNTGIFAQSALDAYIAGNSIYSQKAQSYTADNRPWAINAAISASNGSTIVGNYIRNVYVGIYLTGESTVIGNTLYSIILSGVCVFISNARIGDIVRIADNVIEGIQDDSTSWYGCRAISIGQGSALIEDNLCTSERQPLYTSTTYGKIKVKGLLSNVQYTGSYTPLDGYYEYETTS